MILDLEVPVGATVCFRRSGPAVLASPAAGAAARRLWCFGERLSERLAERE